MEIILGRDQQTRKLNVVVDGKKGLFGQPNSVPLDVSRKHLTMTGNGDGKWEIKNLNDKNVTFVNGMAIESKVVSEKDKVELGRSHYLLQWSLFAPPKQETVDIRPLKRIWSEYNESKKEIAIRRKNTGLVGSIPMGLSMIGGVVSGIATEEIRPYAVVFTIIAFVVMIYGFILRYNDNSIQEEEELKKDFQHRYVCPKCGRYLKEEYDLLIQNNACPYCKVKYIK